MWSVLGEVFVLSYRTWRDERNDMIMMGLQDEGLAGLSIGYPLIASSWQWLDVYKS